MGTYKKGNVYWMIKQYKGKRVERSLETPLKRVAEERHAQIVSRIIDGSYFEVPETKEVEVPKMKEVIERYMCEVSPLGKSHGRNQIIAAHFYSFLGDCLVSDVKPMLSAYKTKRLLGEIIYGKGNGRKAGKSTVKKELSFLRGVFSKTIDEWEEDWGGYFKDNPINPVKKVIKGLKDVERSRYVLPEEAVKLRFTLPQWMKPIVMVGCQTGLREGNIVNLLVPYCDFDNRRINIPEKEMKDGSPFSVKMTHTVKETLLKVIKSRKVISPYVFIDGEGKPYTRNAVSMAFKRACDRAGIKNLRFHDLRHDFATLLVNKGRANLYQVQLTLSHDDPRQTQRYAKLLPENFDVVDRIDGEGTASFLLESEKTTTILRQSEDEGKVVNAASP
jgi:integrase